MMELAIIMADQINANLERLNLEVTPKIADAIAAEMKQNTSRGTAFGSDRYDSKYTELYKAKRKRAGVPTSPVTLRFRSNRIENTHTKPTDNGSVIKFDDPQMGVIFKYHNDGIVYSKVGNRTRSIFPKTGESVPQSIRDLASRLIGEVLLGR
jgi:hypothetical protein